MKIGSKEWFNALEKQVSFPGMYVFYLGVARDDNTKCITVKRVGTKSTNADNVKFGSLSPTLTQALSYTDLLLIKVEYINDTKEYYENLKQYSYKYTNNEHLFEEEGMSGDEL